MTGLLTATAEAEPPRDPFDPARIDPIIETLSRVWHANPHRSFMDVVMEAARHTRSFAPTDVSDSRIHYGIQQIGRTPPRTGS